MKTLIIHHDDCLRHDTGPQHPERPDRVTAVLRAVSGLRGTEVLPAPRATAEQVERAHPAAYRERLAELEPTSQPAAGQLAERVALDPDTWLSAGSLDAALRGSGAACFAIDQIYAGRARNAFCVTRPPGHHAASETAMGFCLLNHAAVAARHAQAAYGAKRVAILDFDVHHGNGTQTLFENSPDVLYVSSHQDPLYPGTGHLDETGCGNIVNMPLQPGSGSAEFRAAWFERGLPALDDFAPDLVILSAGFDAHRRDPLGQLELEDADYGWITAEIRALAERACEGRLVSVLEGGYDLEALAGASIEHVQALRYRL
ncbi:MAG: histone deacetylase family protein [Lysobacterales bacterium]